MQQDAADTVNKDARPEDCYILFSSHTDGWRLYEPVSYTHLDVYKRQGEYERTTKRSRHATGSGSSRRICA